MSQGAPDGASRAQTLHLVGAGPVRPALPRPGTNLLIFLRDHLGLCWTPLPCPPAMAQVGTPGVGEARGREGLTHPSCDWSGAEPVTGAGPMGISLGALTTETRMLPPGSGRGGHEPEGHLCHHNAAPA